MKIKKILSTALTVVIVFATMFTALPINIYAAYVDTSGASNSLIPEGSFEATLTDSELLAYLGETTDTANAPTSYVNYNFESADKMLEHELSKGYLYRSNSADGKYTMYVNKYTGFVYYKNNVTGQILTSNPINPGYIDSKLGSMAVSKNLRTEIMSQISIDFFVSATGEKFTINSYNEAAVRNQLSVTPIDGGFRVNYTLGDTTARFLLPGLISAENFLENIFMPMADKYEELLNQYCSEKYPDENFSFFENDAYVPFDDDGFLNTSSSDKRLGYQYYLKQTYAVYKKCFAAYSAEYKELDRLRNDIIQLFTYYTLRSPIKTTTPTALEKMHEEYPITKEGISIYAFVSGVDDETTKNGIKNYVSKIIKTHCPDYTFAMMYQDEKECLYVDDSGSKPVFRCAFEYTFNADGTLSVRLPANSITFDDTVYTLVSITPLKYFGAGSMDNNGYMFYPDGSGAIIEFSDFYDVENKQTPVLTYTSMVYGNDYCYSEIEGAFKQQITMPVYGLVNDVNANAKTSELTGNTTATNGYFAILEEGSALANLGYESGGSSHKFASVFASYTPYPSDTIDLSETISVGSVKSYTLVSESKYSGSYVTRYVMLADDEVATKVANEKYMSTYMGMASYYRDYLVGTGVLTALENVGTDLPLYIEALGAMDIISRFLSFPVTKSIALTSFSDIITMYDQFADCVNYVNELIAKYEDLAEKEEDEVKKAQYQQEADRYIALKGNIQDIKNVNFRLTGFANGGMKATYPAKLRWQRSCGGKRGFKKLVSYSNKVAETEGQNLGIFPDFDFLYVNHTAMFDGITKKGNASRKVDNRYASKQVYDSVSQTYDVFFTLVISSDVLDKFYTKLAKKYSKFDIDTISVSTFGSDINSNFDEDNPINREQSLENISAVLDKMVNKNGYEVMVDTGNVYTAKYVKHILNLTTDSSHFRYTSYTVPFVGIVLHSYINYAGTPLNYSGTPAYDILRSIENGAAPYYILAYKNTAHMKDDEDLSIYYGVDYTTWYDDIIKTYAELNGAIGELQSYIISDHNILIAERKLEAVEEIQNLSRLKSEILTMLDTQVKAAVDAEMDKLFDLGAEGHGVKIKVSIDRAALINQFCEILNLEAAELDKDEFKADLDKIINSYTSQYVGEAGNEVAISISSIEYNSQYSYITDSYALDKNYVYTDYTIDNGNVTMVTYKNGNSVVKFILNYNIYPVIVKFADGKEYEVGKHSYVKITEGGAIGG